MYVQTLSLWVLLLIASFPKQEWKDANEIANQKREKWEDIFETFDVDSKECEAIIFPELMRYSFLQDWAQQTALMTLYVRGGSSKSDYSVGLFQMKPSFLEKIESLWMNSPLSKEYDIYFPIGNSRDIRQRRVNRIRDEQWQCLYLAIFIKLMLEREPSLQAISPSKRVSYLATAFNADCNASIKQLDKLMETNSFHLDFIPMKKTKFYNYAELAVKRYNELICN